MELEQELRRLVDRTTIIERKCTFARAADSGDPDAMVALFTPDAVAVYDPAEPLEGRDTIRAWYGDRLGPVVSSSHHLSNFEVEFAGPDEAVLRCYLASWQRFDAELSRPDRHRWARYLDTWRRLPEGWFLASLTCLSAGESPPVPGERVGEYRSARY